MDRRAPACDLTLAQVINEFFQQQERKGLSQFTIKHDRDNIRAVGKYIDLDTAVRDVTSAALEVAFDAMRERGLKPNTVIGRRKTWDKLYRYVGLAGYCLTNPVSGVVKMQAQDTEIPSFTKSQLHDLLAQPKAQTFCGLRDRTMMQLLADTGLRLRELLDLQVDQIDTKRRVLRSIAGKNGKLADVPMSQAMSKKLETYLAVRGRPATEAVFVTLAGTPVSRRTFQSRMHEYGQQAGICDVRVSPHTMRHTFAKLWILNGGDAFTLQRILRHSTMDMVNHYIYLWASEIQERHDRFSPVADM